MSERTRSQGAWERTVTELKELAASQPKTEQGHPDSRIVHTQYRGNFFRRFEEIRAIREERATDEQVFYVRMVKERFGFDLLDFYSTHSELCDAVCDAAEAKEPYDHLVAGYHELLQLEEAGDIPSGSADELNAATDHPLGIEAIGIYYWDRINPLLAQAYELVEARTINAPFLAQ